MEERRARAEALTYAYPGARPVLRDVTFSVVGGESLGLLGRNGSGKTSLLRLLAGLLRPTAGEASVTGAARPAVVLDRTPFLETLTAEENLRLSLRLRGVAAEDREASAARWLRIFGLAADRARPVDELSLGMRRRLALAEAFAAAPPVLLLDEPTLGLDPEGRETLVRELRAAAAAGTAGIVATNDARFAARACDRVLLLHGGSIVAAGPPAALVAELAAPTLVELETEPAPPDAEPPPGLRVVARDAASLTLAVPDAAGSMESLWPWLQRRDVRLRALRIREPDLSDVFAARTGERLEPGVGGAERDR